MIKVKCHLIIKKNNHRPNDSDMSMKEGLSLNYRLPLLKKILKIEIG